MGPVLILLPFLLLSLVVVPTGAADNENAESSSVYTIISKANADAITPLVHGDIVQNLQRNADPCTAYGCKWPKRRNNVKVPYVISPEFSKKEKKIIKRAMREFKSNTCIRFVKKKWRHKHYLSIFSGDGCWSYVGRIRGEQNISLSRYGCVYKETVQHELLHALGFHHEQSRSDRDDHIEVIYENIDPNLVNNFEKVQTNNLGTPYDFDSVMQYPNTAFSNNGEPTLVSIEDPDLQFGYATEMSVNDWERVNVLYECSGY